MRKILLFALLLTTLSAICQQQPKSKNEKSTHETNKPKTVSKQKVSLKKETKSTVKTTKKLTVSKPYDHLLDLKHEPE